VTSVVILFDFNKKILFCSLYVLFIFPSFELYDLKLFVEIFVLNFGSMSLPQVSVFPFGFRSRSSHIF
jgi:hypothetical protein